MTNPTLILDNAEHVIARQRTRALVRADWLEVIQCEAQLELCKQLRKLLTEQEKHATTATTATTAPSN